MMKRLILRLLASLAITAALGAPTGAHGVLASATGAAVQVNELGGDSGSFNGHTTVMTPVLLTGGSGNFAFSSDVCQMASAPEPSVDLVGEVGGCSIAASGTYLNIVCGTGSASGTASLVGPDGTETADFTIQFAGGSGVLTGTVNEGDGVTATLAGAVDITPSAPGTPPICTFAFAVSGHFGISA